MDTYTTHNFYIYKNYTRLHTSGKDDVEKRGFIKYTLHTCCLEETKYISSSYI